MKWLKLTVPTMSRVQFVDITGRIAEELRQLQERQPFQNGVCHLYVPHTTAGVTINENADPDVIADLKKGFEKIAPFAAEYLHMEGNSAAHIKATVTGLTATVPVIEGRLALGTWQGIYFCEFDGPRQRSILVGFG